MPFNIRERETSYYWNSTKLDKKKDINVHYQVCVFRGRSENQDGCPGLWLLRHFDFSAETTERNSTKIDRKQDPNVLYQVCFLSDLKTKMAARPLLDWDISDFSSETTKQHSVKLAWKHDINVCVFGPIGKPRWSPGLWMTVAFFDFSSETAERNWRNLGRKPDLNVFYQVWVFQADRKINMPPWSIRQQRWRTVLRFTICGPLGPLLRKIARSTSRENKVRANNFYMNINCSEKKPGILAKIWWQEN